MKQLFIAFLVIDALLHSACGTVSQAPATTTEYALMAAKPYNVETARARERLDRFLSRANGRKRSLLTQTPYVAVQAAILTAADAYPILRRAGRGEFSNRSGSPSDRLDTPVYFLLVFDSRTRQLVGDDGVLVVDTPRRGSVGVFGGNPALYIGEGW
jgi:hypothetical protein